MLTQVGLISSLQGTASVIKSSGETLTLEINSPVFEGDQVVVHEPNAKAIITTTHNQEIIITSDTPATLQLSALEQVAQLQAEILNNDDFDFSELEATAAGPEEQSGFSQPIITEPTENVIEYHSQANTFNSSNQSQQANSDTTSINSISPENDSITPPLAKIEQSFANATEDLQTELQGQITTNSTFSANTQATEYGEINIDESGNWQYSLNNELDNIQELGAGDTLTESIRLTDDNGGIFVIEITVNGSNDIATITGSTRETIIAGTSNNTDNHSTEVHGQLTITDIDSNESSFVADTQIRTTYGTAEINANGEWHYTLNSDLSSIQSLTSDNQLTDSFSVRSQDGSQETIHITIQGSNDTPLLSGTNQAPLNLDITDTVNGHLSINDPDFGQSHFQAETNIAGNYGTGSIDENGQWSYQVDVNHADISSLDSNTLLHDSFVVTTADGTEQTIIIPITNFPASITSTTSHTEEGLAIIELDNNDQVLPPNSAQESTASSDLYIWNADSDTANTDTITAFTLGTEGDTLQLNDLLLESHAEDQLDQFLHFSYDGQDSTIEINTNLEAADQHYLVLNNMDITTVGNTDGEIIQQLIQQGNLDIVGL